MADRSERTLDALTMTNLRYAVQIHDSGFVVAAFGDLADAKRYAQTADYLAVYDIFLAKTIAEPQAIDISNEH